MVTAAKTERTRQAHAPPFVLVLAGGGARGMAQAGVLLSLENHGYRPSVLVGISMGAIVAATFALNPNWYNAVVGADARGLTWIPGKSAGTLAERAWSVARSELLLHNLVFGWGLRSGTVEGFRRLLCNLTLGRPLDEGSLPLAMVHTADSQLQVRT